jgi:transcriptional regulator with XRE-family HTH domain
MSGESFSKNKRSSSAKDLYVAKKLRERRIELGLNQSYLASILGITPQQLSKYEKGLDRIPAGRLDDFAKILSVPISFFYKDKDLGINQAYLKGKKVRIKYFKLKAVLTDIKTQEDYDIEFSWV